MRITFTHLHCPLCQEPISHDFVKHALAKPRKLQAVVEDASVERLLAEGVERDAEMRRRPRAELIKSSKHAVAHLGRRGALA